jgi:hypothetical protein
MVVGADVTHPSPDQKTIPSVAAVSTLFIKKIFKRISLLIQSLVK